MKIFSILETGFDVYFTVDREASAPVRVEFSSDPHNSAVQRLRLVPPGEGAGGLGHAVEITFDRNGSMLELVHQPLDKAPWDRGEPEPASAPEENAAGTRPAKSAKGK